MSTPQDALEPSPELLLQFYRRLYPFKSIFNWLNHEHVPSRLFTHREFAFTLQGDVYLRYNSFASADDLKKQVCQLNPTRFEIGPIYSARPRDKKTVRPAAFVPQQRELVFDIDMTDYDSVRTCCSGADICSRCWKFISVAVRVLHNALKDQFGFQHIMWVYSGRRGIHCWISDDEAMQLTDEQRRSIVNYLIVIQGGQKAKRVNVRMGTSKALPPSLKSAIEHLRNVFVDLILVDQELFKSKEQWELLLELLPDASVVEHLRKIWSDNPEQSSEEKWMDLKNAVKKCEKGPKREAMVMAMEDIVLQYMYPRIDAEVSKHRNHLLKAPFCVHPKTGRVCVPVDPERIEDFVPEEVPTVAQLLRELDTYMNTGTKEGDEDRHDDWSKTSLKVYVDMLDRHTLSIMDELRIKKRGKVDMTW